MGALELEYPVTHPYPRGKAFTAVTYAFMVLVLPVLVLINIVAMGYDLVPSLQAEFKPQSTVQSWPNSPQLPRILRRTAPSCEPKNLGKGDTLRLSPSLFEYNVLSSWRTGSSYLRPQAEGRVEYKGGSFRNCSVYEMLFEHNVAQRTQTITAAVVCPEDPVRVFMEAPVVLAAGSKKGIVSQYYGYDMNRQNIGTEDSRDYRQAVFGILDVISTDSLATLLHQHLVAPISSLSLSGDVVESGTSITFHGGTIAYQNGNATQLYSSNNLAQAEIYRASITNIMLAVQHAIELDLGNPGPNNIFTNPAAVNNVFSPNLAPAQIDPSAWMGNESSYAHGYVTPPYQTWAQMIQAGPPQGLPLGNLTGLPADSKMLTSYLCPIYLLKPTGALLANVFIGTATMLMCVWAAWMTLSGIIARRVKTPCMVCRCSNLEQGTMSDNCHHYDRAPRPGALVQLNRYSTFSANEKRVSIVDNGIQELPRTGSATGKLAVA